MTQKNNKRASSKKLATQLAALKIANKKRSKKSTPFRDTGGILGKSIGGMLGIPQLAGVGKWLGSGIGSIFGSGDYQLAGPQPGYNTLSGQTPKFSATHATNIVCHREYLGDISGNGSFTNASYPLNPGMATTFPWLSTIAANYQQYRFHGLIFEFRPLITDFVTGGSPGVIVMTTNYNADDDPFISRQEAENAEFAVAVKPTNGLVHMIECAADQTQTKLFNVRTQAVKAGQDLRLYDLGLTQIITQNNPVQNLGELWVSYNVEFFKPTLASSNDFEDASGFHSYRATTSSGNPLGLVQITRSGNVNAVITGNSIAFSNLDVGSTYQLHISQYCSIPTTISLIAPTLIGLVGVNYLINDTLPAVSGTGTLSTNSYLTMIVAATSIAATMTFTGSTLGTGTTSCDIWFNKLDSTIVN
jgi:hypothetical protein